MNPAPDKCNIECADLKRAIAKKWNASGKKREKRSLFRKFSGNVHLHRAYRVRGAATDERFMSHNRRQAGQSVAISKKR